VVCVKGSYAGAMGFPQFIASSYRHYAIDFNKDGKVDLFSDPIDAIGSIANYFDKHQWHDYGQVSSFIFCGKRIKANLVSLLMSASMSKPLLRQCLAFFFGLELVRLACFRCLIPSEIGRAISP
jgi:hypothetical protein